jgi:hypothetical protein
MRSRGILIQQAKHTELDTLIADAQIGLTFLDSAETTADVAARSRSIVKAGKAYFTIMNRLPNLTLDDQQAEPLRAQLRLLRRRLIRLGIFTDRGVGY